MGIAFEHTPLMVNGEDFETLKTINPAGRVPALKLDDGTILIETFAILDYLQELAGPNTQLLPASGQARRDALQTIAFANTTKEKAVALVYDFNRRPEAYHWPEWIDRLKGQITGALVELEARAPANGFAGGTSPNGADVAMVCAVDFVSLVHPELAAGIETPKLAALSARANAFDAFKNVPIT